MDRTHIQTMDATTETAAAEQELSFPAFPYPPYDIQLGFMRSLYLALEQGGVGLFESPTGTGKTLSLICSSLQWLEDSRRREQAQQAQQQAQQQQQPAGGGGADGAAAGCAADAEDAEPDWMRDFSSSKEEEQRRDAEERRRKRLQAVREGLAGKAGGGGRQGTQAQQQRQQAATGSSDASDGDPDSEFLMESCDSDGGEGSGASRKPAPKRRRLSGDGGGGRVAVAAGGDESSGDESEGELGGAGVGGEEEELAPPKQTQVLFTSRTHSQLSQFVGELRRTPFADRLSLVALASRKALCINDKVLALGSASLINERCLEMQKPQKSSGGSKGGKKSSSSGRCPFLACGTQAASSLHDHILAQPLDIEELGTLGRRKSVCPYYAARRALAEADVVLAPYSSLLVEDTRQALGLRVEENVVVVDEGHNLVDAINSSHSAELSAAQASAARSQLAAYFERFRTQLAPGNARHLQTLMSVAAMLARQLDAAPAGPAGPAGATSPAAGSGGGGVSVSTVNDFLLASGLDNINLFRLVQHVRDSKAVFKVAGYAQALQKRAAAAAAAAGGAAAAGVAAAAVAGAPGAGAGAGAAAAPEGSTGALHALVGFMQALTNADSDGRVIVDRRAGAPEGGTLRFVLLNAAAHFEKVVSSARSVVLASGTLSPIEPVLQLFPGTPRDAIHQYSCGHVVGRDRLLALAVGLGPSGARLDFRHASRSLPATLDELGRLVVNASKVVPGGLVLFFPSFSYADQVYERWEATGVLRQLAARKRIFREPRSAGEVEALLQKYASCIVACSTSGSSTINSGAKGSSTGSSNAGGGCLASGGKENIALGGLSQQQQQQQGCGGSSGNNGSGSSGGPAAAGGGSGSGLTGAVLLCVVGGKLSEGINFGDALGRCVVMVGLPYPNPSDPELQERLRFIERQAAAAAAVPLLPSQPIAAQAPAPVPTPALAEGAAAATAGLRMGPAAAAVQVSQGQQQLQPDLHHHHHHHHQQQQQQRASGLRSSMAGAAGMGTAAGAAASSQPPSCAVAGAAAAARPAPSSLPTPTEASRQYYEDLCMKAVNQCVGRVVRHARDYAAVLLVDVRYAAGVSAPPAVPAGTAGAGGSAAAACGSSGQAGGSGGNSGGQAASSGEVTMKCTGPLAKLPGWVRESLVPLRAGGGGSFGEAYGQLARFFKRMQSSEGS